MVLITNTEKRQLMLFPDPTLPVIPPREARDDVHNGDVAETIAMLALKLVGYHCLPSMQGKKYDFGVEIEIFGDLPQHNQFIWGDFATCNTRYNGISAVFLHIT